MPLLFGEHDRNLARIEQKLKVSLSSFGNTLRISGDEETAPVAQKTIEALYTRLEDDRGQGKKNSVLDFGVVDAAVKFASRTEVEVGAFNDRSAVVDTWKQVIRPRSPTQKTYIEALQTDELVFGLGPAGTGKTYLAVAVAVAMLKARVVDRLILSRPAVEAGERLGFLPGDMKDKIDPYLRPLYDGLYDTMPGEQVEKRLQTGEIEARPPLAFMRGRTWQTLSSFWMRLKTPRPRK